MAGVLAADALPKALDELTDPNIGVTNVTGLFPVKVVGKSMLLALLSGRGEDNLSAYDPIKQDLSPVTGLGDVDNAWRAEGASILVKQDSALWLATVHADLTVTKSKVLQLGDVKESDACWVPGVGVCVFTLEDRNPPLNDEAPIIYPPPPRPLLIRYFHPALGWRDVGQVPETSEDLHASPNGTRCAFRVMTNLIPEEAERGEIWVGEWVRSGADDLGQGRVGQVTNNAGRVGTVRLSEDGSSIAFNANDSLDRPITTHCPVWSVAWPPATSLDSPLPTDAAKTTPSSRPPGSDALDFGFVDGAVWISHVVGVNVVTEVCGSGELPHAATSGAIIKLEEALAYCSETLTSYPYLVHGANTTALPQRTEWDDVHGKVVEWAAPDGTKLQGTFFQKTGAAGPLLVHAHGGPAISIPALRSVGAGANRYPYRHLLSAGYKIFTPYFRGTLGFGDAFAQANIRSQGDMSSDLGDILSGIDHLVSLGDASPKPIGIFGGSYGGYMTLRALACAPDRFTAGVAMYGFVHGRMMTLEGGDFTWEEEYVEKLKWPYTDSAASSDVFQYLGNINSPTLLPHGADDDICPISQSFIALRALQERGVPTGLVSYPGEGHGFDKDPNRQDRDRRTLLWFQQHLN